MELIFIIIAFLFIVAVIVSANGWVSFEPDYTKQDSVRVRIVTDGYGGFCVEKKFRSLDWRPLYALPKVTYRSEEEAIAAAKAYKEEENAYWKKSETNMKLTKDRMEKYGSKEV